MPMIVCQRAPRDKKEKGDEKNGRLHPEYQREECGPQTCGAHRGHRRVQRDHPVRYPEQPVRVCIVYELGASHPPVEKIREAYTARIVYQDSDGKSSAGGQRPTARSPASTPVS